MSWYEAAAYAEFAGKSLPTLFHWNNTASSFRLSSDIIPLSNDGGQALASIGAHRGISSGGTYDMAGNGEGMVLERG
ncbi:MAG: hypothetical protein O2960_10240 [Verrucomicrobia bacterium]|nr:hypothetical protein [Verrucomicrobiota bacterium]